MTRAVRGKPGRQLAPLKEKTVHAQLTKQRIHAIVGQVIDELERRRAKGKSDYVAMLADEIEKGGISAWRSLRDLLPQDDSGAGIGVAAGAAFAGIFAGAAAQAAAQSRVEPPASDDAALPIIDVTAEPVTATEDQQHEPVGEDEPVNW